MSSLPNRDITTADARPAAPAQPNASGAARRWESVAMVVLGVSLICVSLFFQLGTPTFWDPDEAHYAQTSREMITSGDWLAPYYNEEPFFDKPALFHMLQGGAMAIFGSTEFAARLVPALAALALIAVTFWLGRTIDSLDVGVVGAFLLTASPAVFALARYAILDTLFAAFLFGGASCVTVAALNDRPRLQWLGYVLVAFAVLTKGPLALALCGLAFIVACVASSDLRRRLLRLHWLVGAIIVLAIAAPWFAYMWWRFGDAFVHGYVLDENIRLFAASRFANQPGPWFYFQILATGLLPWTGVIVGRLVDDVRAVASGERLDSFEILLWSWVAVVVGFFTASTFKLDHYVFPAAPALALLFARGWADLHRAPLARRNLATRIGGWMVGPLLVVMGVGIGFFIIARLELPAAAIAVPIVITACGVAVTAFINVQVRHNGPPPRVPWFGLTALLTAYLGIILFALPALEHRKVVPDVARVVAAKASPEHRIASYRLNRWNPVFRFYVQRHVTLLENPVEAGAFFDGASPFYCVMHRSAFEEFVAQGKPLRVVYEREGMYASSGRALWRRRLNPAQFVVVEPAR